MALHTNTMSVDGSRIAGLPVIIPAFTVPVIGPFLIVEGYALVNVSGIANVNIICVIFWAKVVVLLDVFNEAGCVSPVYCVWVVYARTFAL